MSTDALENRDALSFRQLVAWAWRETAPVHTNPTNLLIHILAVPLFLLGHLLVLAALVLNGWLAALGLLCIIVSMALQGFGHSLEPQQAHAFTGARDFVRRFYAEQFCNFWRFLFSGQWYSSLRTSSPDSASRRRS